MARVNAKTDFDVDKAEDVLAILENLSRDLTNIEDRQKRLDEMGIALKLKASNGEIVVELTDA